MTALRENDWTDDQYMRAAIVNELRASRADGTEMKPAFLKSPRQIRDEEAEAEHMKRARRGLMRQMQRKI